MVGSPWSKRKGKGWWKARTFKKKDLHWKWRPQHLKNNLRCMWKVLNAQSGRWTHICCKSYDKANIELMWQLCTLTASLFDFSFTPTVTSAHPDPGVMVPEPSIESPVPALCEIGCQSVKLCPVSNQSYTNSLPNTWSCVQCQKYPSSPGSCCWLLPPSLPSPPSN